MEQIVDMTGFEDVRDAYQAAMDKNTLTNFAEDDLVETFRGAGFTSVEIVEDDSRFPVRGKEWAHGFRYGAPAGYNAFDMLLTAGISPERADEFLGHGERLLGDEWRVWRSPWVYLIAVRSQSLIFDPPPPPSLSSLCLRSCLLQGDLRWRSRSN